MIADKTMKNGNTANIAINMWIQEIRKDVLPIEIRTLHGVYDETKQKHRSRRVSMGPKNLGGTTMK